MTTAIEAVDLFKIHRTPEGDAAALQGLSFAVEEGELVALLGPSGSGKSTLVRVLAGLERPSAGTAWVLGSELGRLGARRVAALRSASIGVVHQEDGRALPPNLTVQETVALPARLDGSRRRAALADAAALLAELGLGDRAGDATTVLSGGERQRVALAAALVRRPRLILADEPAGELDDANAALVHDLLRAAATDHGATVLVTSHDPTTAERADRTVRIVDGRVAESRGGGEPFSPLVDGRGWLRLPDALWRRAHGLVPVDVTGSEGELVIRRHDGAPLRPAADERADAPPPRPGAVVARLLGVRRGFADGDRRREVVDEFDLDLVGGLVTCLHGRSGTGKSTLLRLLAAVDDPDEGKVELAGVEVAPLDRAARAALRRDVLGVVEQDPGVVPFLTALENVVLDAALVAPRSGAGELEREARRWLEQVGLKHRMDHRTWRLSAGERQRVAIARALVRGPRLLLLDEPTSRLDAASTIVVADLVLACARSTGAAVVVATHEREVVDRCDVVVELPLPSSASTGPTRIAGTTVH